MEIALWAVGVVCALATVVAYRRRETALVLLGAVGLIVSLAFEHLSAPDLMLTQLLVEVVSVILMMLALHYLPQGSPPEASRARLLRDGVLAVLAGAAVALVTYAVLNRTFRPISDFFLEKSLSEGGGTNVVNVILVDFRGFDTFGEITVLAIAGLAIYALLRGVRMPEPPGERLRPAEDKHPLILRVASRFLLPLAIMVALYLFNRGHNLPGGGFIAGLVFAAAVLLQYVASGTRWVESRTHANHHRWIGAGLLIAGGTGLASWFVGYPFLTSTFAHPKLPLVGEVPLASAALFDVGVFLTVVGATMLALSAIGRISAGEVASEGEAAGGVPS